jgi:hypothetical protein
MEALFCCAILLVIFGMLSLLGLRRPPERPTTQEDGEERPAIPVCIQSGEP